MWMSVLQMHTIVVKTKTVQTTSVPLSVHVGLGSSEMAQIAQGTHIVSICLVSELWYGNLDIQQS